MHDNCCSHQDKLQSILQRRRLRPSPPFHIEILQLNIYARYTPLFNNYSRQINAPEWFSQASVLHMLRGGALEGAFIRSDLGELLKAYCYLLPNPQEIRGANKMTVSCAVNVLLER